MRITAPLAMAFVLVASAVLAASPQRVRPSVHPRLHVVASQLTALETTSAVRVAPRAAWAEDLPGVVVFAKNTNATGTIRLYASDGSVDEDALAEFTHVCGNDKGPAADVAPLARRLVMLVFRASHHFGNAQVTVVSANRKGATGRHGDGEAIDFSLEGVKASELAAFLRTTPRAGVGIYTHPKTQYVHLDVRDRSFHWIDASPPGVTWREAKLADPKQVARDASWNEAMDLPEPAARRSTD